MVQPLTLSCLHSTCEPTYYTPIVKSPDSNQSLGEAYPTPVKQSIAYIHGTIHKLCSHNHHPNRIEAILCKTAFNNLALVYARYMRTDAALFNWCRSLPEIAYLSEIREDDIYKIEITFKKQITPFQDKIIEFGTTPKHLVQLYSKSSHRLMAHLAQIVYIQKEGKQLYTTIYDECKGLKESDLFDD